MFLTVLTENIPLVAADERVTRHAARRRILARRLRVTVSWRHRTFRPCSTMAATHGLEFRKRRRRLTFSGRETIISSDKPGMAQMARAAVRTHDAQRASRDGVSSGCRRIASSNSARKSRSELQRLHIGRGQLECEHAASREPRESHRRRLATPPFAARSQGRVPRFPRPDARQAAGRTR